MGMAAHQSRFLALTSRQNSIGLQLTKLSAEKMALARDTQKVSKKYNEALSAKMLTWSNNSGLDYTVLTYKTMMTPNSLNSNTPYYISDKDGRIVLDSKYAKYAELISPDGAPTSIDWKNSPKRSEILGQITGLDTSAESWIENNFESLKPYRNDYYDINGKSQWVYTSQKADTSQITTEKDAFNNWLINRAKAAYCEANKLKTYDDSNDNDNFKAYKEYLNENPTLFDYYEYKSEQADGYANMLEYYEGVVDFYNNVNFHNNADVKTLATKIGDTGYNLRRTLNIGNITEGKEGNEGQYNKYNFPLNGAETLHNWLYDYVTETDKETYLYKYKVQSEGRWGTKDSDYGTAWEDTMADEIIKYYKKGIDENVKDDVLKKALEDILNEMEGKTNSAYCLKQLFNNDYYNNNANGGGVWRTILFTLIEKAAQRVSEQAAVQLSAGTNGGSDTTIYDRYQAALDNKNNVFSADQLVQIEFYDKLFASIAENGWVENERINDSEYLNNMLQNNQYMITTQRLVEGDQWQNCYYNIGNESVSLGGKRIDWTQKDVMAVKAIVDNEARAGYEEWGTKDHYTYDTDLAINFDKIYTVSDSDLQAEALSEYEAQKALIKSKESRIDTRMRNLETEQAAISERKKALEAMLKENTERLNVFSA